MSISVLNNNKGKEVEHSVMNDSLAIVVNGIHEINKASDKNTRNESALVRSITRTLQGVSGHTEGFKKYSLYATDAGGFDSSVPFNESYATWSFQRRGYTIKGRSITKELLDLAKKEDRDLVPIMKERMNGLAGFYLTNYLSNIPYETLFKAPTYDTERTYYSQPDGFLRGESVDSDMLVHYAKNNTRRNHYRAIPSNDGVVTMEDFRSIAEYMSQYVDIKNENIIYTMNRKELNKALAQFEMEEPEADYDMGYGYETIELSSGIRVMVNDYMPNNWVATVNTEASDIITKLESPQEEYRGLALVNPKGFAKFESLYDIVGAEFKIMPEGYHITGRHQVCFLYTGAHNLFTGDGNHTIPIDGDGDHVIKTLNDHARALRDSWYRGLR